MNIKNIILATLLFASCAQAQKETKSGPNPVRSNQHEYGGWYCPDNLFGFPAVDLQEWDQVPAISGRLPTEEEAKNHQSLIYVDQSKHPDAYALDIKVPKLARYYSGNSRKSELVIVIQAVNVKGDNIVGFRYLNGGNGSAYLDEVTFLSQEELSKLTTQKFASMEVVINAPVDKVWEILTNINHKTDFEPILSKNTDHVIDWRAKSNFNYYYNKRGIPTSTFKDRLFGNWYIQNDYEIEKRGYVEKILLLKDEDSNGTKLKLLFGPFEEDHKEQQELIDTWTNMVKSLSEN